LKKRNKIGDKGETLEVDRLVVSYEFRRPIRWLGSTPCVPSRRPQSIEAASLVYLVLIP
jgi:hypothetical protein